MIVDHVCMIISDFKAYIVRRCSFLCCFWGNRKPCCEGLYYGLNAFVSLECVCWNSNSQDNGTWRWGFGRWLGHDGRAPLMRSVLSQKEELPHSFCMWGHSEEVDVCTPEQWGEWFRTRVVQRMAHIQRRLAEAGNTGLLSARYQPWDSLLPGLGWAAFSTIFW